MTANRKRPCDLAMHILQHETFAQQINDLDWTLLLLAASLNSPDSTDEGRQPGSCRLSKSDWIFHRRGNAHISLMTIAGREPNALSSNQHSRSRKRF